MPSLNNNANTDVEKAVGDGHCAFNSFLLGLTQEHVLEAIEKNKQGQDLDVLFKAFLDEAKDPLGAKDATWSVVKAAMLDARRVDKVNLQKKLGIVLRRLAIDILKQKTISYDFDAHESNLEDALQAEFYNFLHPEIPGVQGDIFLRHPVIKLQFEAIKQGNASLGRSEDERDTKNREDLAAWWKATGYALFLEEMRRSDVSAGVSVQHAGDLELAPLGAYFGVNLRLFHGASNSVDEILVLGVLPVNSLALDSNDVKQLYERHILRHGDKFNRLSKKQLSDLIAAVPGFDALLDYVDSGAAKKGTPVPATWDDACIQQLIARGLINSDKTIAFDWARPVLLERIRAIPEESAQKILSAYDQYYHQNVPDISLQNIKMDHWNHLPSAALVKAVVIKPPVFVATEEECLANDAVGEILDVLTKNSDALDPVTTKNLFAEAFDALSLKPGSELSSSASAPAASKSPGFFATEKNRLIAKIEAEVKAKGHSFKP